MPVRDHKSESDPTAKFQKKWTKKVKPFQLNPYLSLFRFNLSALRVDRIGCEQERHIEKKIWVNEEVDHPSLNSN